MPTQRFLATAQLLTFLRSSVLAGLTSAVLALRVLVGVVGLVLVTVFLAAGITVPEGDDADVFTRGVVAVLAAKATRLGRRPVLRTLTGVTLASLDTLHVLHGAGTDSAKFSSKLTGTRSQYGHIRIYRIAQRDFSCSRSQAKLYVNSASYAYI